MKKDCMEKDYYIIEDRRIDRSEIIRLVIMGEIEPHRIYEYRDPAVVAKLPTEIVFRVRVKLFEEAA